MTPPRSDHFNGKTFSQPHHLLTGNLRDLWRWKLTARPRPWPRHVGLPRPSPPPAPRDGEIVATWIGHATFLLQTSHANLLLDPVFSERASPFAWRDRDAALAAAGVDPKDFRVVAPGASVVV